MSSSFEEAAIALAAASINERCLRIGTTSVLAVSVAGRRNG